MERRASMPLGVVIERRRSKSPWQEWIWRPVSVIPGAPAVGAEGRELIHGEGWTHYHAATLPLELHRGETEAYLLNLSQRPPRVYVVLRPASEPCPHPYRPLLVTASPYEAESYQESGDEIVEGVVMPELVVSWVQAFVQRHHVDRPFVKRKRWKLGAPSTEHAPSGSERPASRIGGREDG
ncbi:MAG: DUF3305 domain-containing protein [Geminicoccaceae bacterium]